MADWNKVIFELTDVRILSYLKKEGKARYSELLGDVVESRSTLAESLRQLQSMRLINRVVKATRPIQTEYVLTDKGDKVIRLLTQVKELIQPGV